MKLWFSCPILAYICLHILETKKKKKKKVILFAFLFSLSWNIFTEYDSQTCNLVRSVSVRYDIPALIMIDIRSQLYFQKIKVEKTNKQTNKKELYRYNMKKLRQSKSLVIMKNSVEIIGRILRKENCIGNRQGITVLPWN